MNNYKLFYVPSGGIESRFFSLLTLKFKTMYSKPSKLFYLTLLLFFISHGLYSQNSFTVTLKDSTYDNMVHSAIELSNGQFIVVSVRILQPGSFAANIIKLDAYGNLLHQNILRFNGNSSGFTSIVQLSENRFILSGATYPGSSGYLWVCTIDSSLNVITQRSYMLWSYSVYYCKSILDYQNNILVFGKVWSSGTPYSFVFKLTSDLDSISCRIYNEQWSMGQDLIERSDHKGYYFLIIGFNLGSGKILSLDPAFNIEKITVLNDGIGNLGTIKLFDSTRFMVCAVKTPTNSMSQKIGVQLYDTTFNLIHYSFYGKTDTTEQPAMVKSLDFSDPSSVFIGGTSNITTNEFYETDNWYRLNNIDTSFNLKWERFYGGNGYYTLYGILATHDGGCLMYGTFWDYHNITDYTRYIRLIKVSKDGLLSDENGKSGIKLKEVILYPNPGTDRVTIETALKNVVVSFFDVYGNRVLKKPILSMVETLDVSELSTGIYFYRFTDGDRVVETGKWIKK